MPTGIYCVHIAEFNDDYKPRGCMPSESTLKYFTDESTARAWIREWFIQKDFLKEYELDKNKIKTRFESYFGKDESMKGWCDAKGVPLTSCPSFDDYIKAMLPGEFIPYKFEIHGPTEITLEAESNKKAKLG